MHLLGALKPPESPGHSQCCCHMRTSPSALLHLSVAPGWWGMAAVLLQWPRAAGGRQGQHSWPERGRLPASLALPETRSQPRCSGWCPPGWPELLEQELPCCRTLARKALRPTHVSKPGYCLQMGSRDKLFRAAP